MTETIKNQLDELAKTVNSIPSILNSDKKFGNTEKETLFLAYHDLDMEHIEALHLLLRKELHGSAFALVRTFYETFYRALWMFAFATDEQVNKIRNGKYDFPNMGSKILELDSYYTGDEFFKNMKQGTWNNMCDYTHSGTCQLSRRWTNNELVPNYNENEILEVIIHTRKIILLFTYTLVKIHGYTDDEVKVLNLIENDNKNSQSILDTMYEKIS